MNKIKGWPPCLEAQFPKGCICCRICNDYCMGAETVEPDWYGRGKVIRIFSLCDKSMKMENEEVRTEFGTVEEAVLEWNQMNEVLNNEQT